MIIQTVLKHEQINWAVPAMREALTKKIKGGRWFEPLKDSIKKHGILNPIICEASKAHPRVIIRSGHQRLVIAQELDIEELNAIILIEPGLDPHEYAPDGFINITNRAWLKKLFQPNAPGLLEIEKRLDLETATFEEEAEAEGSKKDPS